MGPGNRASEYHADASAGLCYPARMIRVVILGDIVGKPGVRAVTQQLPVIRERYQPDLVVVNAENAANGTGLTPSLYQRLIDLGIDGITLGDHVYKKLQIVSTLQRESNIIRPANLSHHAAGKTWMKLRPRRQAGAAEYQGPGIYVVTVLGRLFMNMPANDPFATAEAVIAQLPEPAPIVLLEIHAEATSEKKAMGWHFNGKVAAVFGTHTHVPTHDARILPSHLPESPQRPVRDDAAARGGTAYITDLGMCGPQDSVLGRRVDRVLHAMTTNMPTPFDVAEGHPQVQGVCITIDETTRRATAIEPIILDADVTRPPFDDL